FHRSDSEEVGSATAQLQYSTNAGRTWTNAGGSQAVNVEHHRITATINTTARVLLVRVNVSVSSGLAPILAALWGDWRVTDADGCALSPLALHGAGPGQRNGPQRGAVGLVRLPDQIGTVGASQSNVELHRPGRHGS